MPSLKQKLKQKTHKLLSPFRSHSKGRATSAQPTPRPSADAPLAEGAGPTGGAATLPRESSPAARPSGIDTPPVGGSGPTGAGGTATPPLRGRSPSPRFNADTSPRGGVGPPDGADAIEDPETSGGTNTLAHGQPTAMPDNSNSNTRSESQKVETRVERNDNVVSTNVPAESSALRSTPDESSRAHVTGVDSVHDSDGGSGVLDSVANVMLELADPVIEVTGVFPPLKIVVVGLKLILEHSKASKENKEKAKELMDRIVDILETLKNSLNDPVVCDGCQKLTKKLEGLSKKLLPAQGNPNDGAIRDWCKRFLKASINEGIVEDCVKTVDRALVDYQVWRQEEIEKSRILSGLKYVSGATLRAVDRPRCVKGTRAEVLQDLSAWASSEDSQQLFWLHGSAGSGKSTIALSFAEELNAKSKLGASFFCSRNSEETRNLRFIFPTIAFQLANLPVSASLPFRDALVKALKRDPSGTSLSLNDQLQELIVRPMEGSQMKAIIVIDALDECRDTAPASELLSVLTNVPADMQSLRFFITSRPEFHIRISFRIKQLDLRSDKQALNELPSDQVDRDIKLYLQGSFEDMQTYRPDVAFPVDWPSPDMISTLTAKAAGLFIFASTVVKFSGNTHYNPVRRLSILLAHPDEYKTEGTQGLDKLYLDILSAAAPEPADNDFLTALCSVLGLLVVAYESLSAATIAELLQLAVEDVCITLNHLHSLILVPEDPNTPIRFHHKSFPDFLTDTNRCTDIRFFVDRDRHHFLTSHACLLQLQQCLKKNICSVPRYTLNDDIDHEHIRRCINEAIEYYCHYWINHLLASTPSDDQFLEIHKPLLEFLKTRQLQWFEAFALVESYGLYHPASKLLGQLQDWLESCKAQHKDEVLQWIIEGRHFLDDAEVVISSSVAHIYHSALPFCPTTSLFRHQYEHNLNSEVDLVVGVNTYWPMLTRYIQLDNERSGLMEFSPDDSMLFVAASKSSEATVSCKIYSTRTCGKIVEFDEFTPISYGTITWSPDNKIIATASHGVISFRNCRTAKDGVKQTSQMNSDILTIEFHHTLNHLLLYHTSGGEICLWNTDCGSHQSVCNRMDTDHLCWLKNPLENKIVVSIKGQVEIWSLDVNTAHIIGVTELPFPLSDDNGSCPNTRGTNTTTVVKSSNDGSLVALTFRKYVSLYRVDMGDCIRHVHLGDDILQMQFLSTSRGHALAVTGSGWKVLRVIHVDPKIEKQLEQALAEQIEYQEAHDPIIFSPKGNGIAFCDSDGDVVIGESCGPTHFLDQVAANQAANPGFNRGRPLHLSVDGKLLCIPMGHTVEVQDIHRRERRTPIILPEGHTAHQVIILSDNIHVAVLHSRDDDNRGLATVALWNLQSKDRVAQDLSLSRSRRPIRGHPRSPTTLFPYTHTTTIGYFLVTSLPLALAGAPTYSGDSSPPTTDVAAIVVCCTLDPKTNRLVTTARGNLEVGDPVQIYDTVNASGAEDFLTIHMEYADGRHFLAAWDSTTTTATSTHSPRKLKFVEEINSEGHSICKQSYMKFDRPWIVNEQGRRVLRLPWVYRNHAVYYRDSKNRLHTVEGIEYPDKPMIVVDFSRVDTTGASIL